MTAPETRIVNQCTYTPIVNDPNIGDDLPGFKPKQPFVKQNLLAIVFNDPQYSSFLFENLTNGNEKIQTAVEEMWKGNTVGLATILNEIEVDEIANFARTVLQVEQNLIQNARQDIEESASSVVENERTKSVVSEVESALDQSEATIVPLVQDKDVVVQSVQKAFADVKREIVSLVEKQGTGQHVIDQAQLKIATITTKLLPVMAKEKINTNKVAVFKSKIDNLQKSLGTLVGRVESVDVKVSSVLLKNHPQTSNLMTALRVPINSNGSQRLTSTYSTRFRTGYQPGAAAEFKDWYGDEETIVNASVDASKQFLDYQEEINQKKQKALDAALETMKVEPVGYLHLERLQFTPVGYERGELVYSLPLTPGETVRLSHREWSRTETEYTQLVATSLETASEDLLSEKSELAQSSKTEDQHSSAFNASATASGGYGPVHISTSVGYSSQNSATRSAENSVKHSQEITKKASSRSTQEHKFTFRVTTQYEVEDESYREITNKSDRAVRWDFHRLMKKWQIDLYRYDARLTYDIVVPEPGNYLLRKYIQLKNLNDLISRPFSLDLKISDITRDGYKGLMEKYQVALDPPLSEEYVTEVYKANTFSGERIIGYDHLEIVLPDDYYFDYWDVKGSKFFKSLTQGGTYEYRVDFIDHTSLFGDWTETILTKPIGYILTMWEENNNALIRGAKYSNRYVWRYYYDWWEREEAKTGCTLSIKVLVRGKLTAKAFLEWQTRCFEQLTDAAKAQHESEQQRLKKVRDNLLAELSREDALMLRKLEKEETMKNVLRWVLGPAFSFYPSGLPTLSLNSSGQLEYYEDCTVMVDYLKWPRTLVAGGVKQETYERMIQYGEIIRFLHQAIEWENVNYVLYPYFWTDETRWDFKQFLYHADYVHRSFLRAGAARVVLTIRPGFEKAFLSFMENGTIGKLLTPDDRSYPYMTVADELKAMALTNYPYTPNANEEKEENRVDRWYEFTPTGALDVTEGTIVESSGPS